ncbi:MAG TPA: PKD domain-containing protein, partial [Bacteroidia bacterium]|nr:PKD domain-containing protein [Bacteroidia bacterium]
AMTGTTSICDGNNTNLSILFTGTGPYSYSYNDGTSVFGPFVTNQNPVLINVNPSSTTTYGVTTVSDANCAGTVSGLAAVTVIPLPTSTLTGSTEICRGSNTNLNLAFTGAPPFEYIYTDGASTFGPTTTNNFNTLINVGPLNTTSYHVTVVTGNGCTGTPSGNADIIVNPIPQATVSLSGDAEICSGESSEFIISFIGNSPYTYSYTDGTNVFGPFTTVNNPEIIPVTPSATATYSLVNMSDEKCTGTMAGTAQVIVNPLPQASAIGNPSICYGSSTTFNIAFTGTAPYTYSYSDGTTTYGPFTTSNNPEIISVSPTVSTSYNVLTISDAKCTGSVSGVANVTVNQIPTATLTGTSSICFGQNSTLNINFTGVAPFSYTYSNGSNNIGPFTATSTSVNIPVSPGTTTSYSLVTINDANCPGTIAGNATVTVNPLPEPVITGDFEICDGETSTLNATPGYVTYTWSNGSTTPSIDVTQSGILNVSVIDINGCAGTSPAINFIVNQTPVISFTNDTSLTCEIPEINFTNNSSFPAGSQFNWDFGDNTSSNLSNPSHIFNTPGNYPITLTIVTPAGCTSTQTQAVDILFFPLPEAKFEPNPTVTNVFNAKVLFQDQSQNAVTWLWNFNDGALSAEQNPSHYFNEIGQYLVKLIVTNVAGCVDEYVQEVIVNPFYIPNAFTPNADGINDYFYDAGYVLDVQSYHMNIFNRWGQKVFGNDDYTKFWNGYDLDGNKASEGVYVYTIDVVTRGGKKHHFEGTVSLIR